jgi:luciferase family oxidoreductase group 1
VNDIDPLPALPLSVLEVAPVGAATGTTQALQATLALAVRAEELGFTRIWVAEHHGMPGIASSAPAVLISAIASATHSIRVGSGGVMLPNHAPLVVAEQFGTLGALYPGRIDLGLGRAPGTDPRTAAALRRGPGMLSADDFPQQLGELACFLAGEFPDGHPYQNVGAVPHAAVIPPIWLLGSSDYSAHLAGLLGLPFAFAHHFSGANTLPALQVYRDSFRPSAGLEEPYPMVTAQVVCAEDDASAERLALPAALSFLRLRQGRPAAAPSVEEAAAYPWTDAERAFVADRWANQAIGGPDTVAERLGDLLKATEASELMITTQVQAADERIRSLERTRALFGAAELPKGIASAGVLGFPPPRQ